MKNYEEGERTMKGNGTRLFPSAEGVYLRCFLLMLLNFLVDFFFFYQRNLEQIIIYAQYHSPAWGMLRLMVHAGIQVCVLTAIFGLLYNIPRIGPWVHWGVWLVLNVSYHIFYVVMHRVATPQEIRDLIMTPYQMASESILAFLSLRVVLQGLLPILIVLACFLLIDRRWLAKFKFGEKNAPFRRWAGVNLAALIIVALYLHRPVSGNVRGDAFANSLHVLMAYHHSAQLYEVPRLPYVAESPQEAPTDNLLLVIDESVRGDYLSINNASLDTTPILEGILRAHPDNSWNYGVAVSAGTNTFSAQTAILTGISALPDNQLTALKHPTIFQVAKANHYRTVFIDLQGAHPDAVIKRSDMAFVDEERFGWSGFSMDPKMADLLAARYLRSRFEEERGLFVVLCKWGVHVHYEARYPGKDPEHQHYLPKLDEGEHHDLTKRQKIINSYKNAIRFNIDSFFSELFGGGGMPPDTTVLWVSDHGQSFQEDGQLGPHGGDSLEPALIPLVVFSTEPWVSQNIKRPQNMGTLSQLNVYPTLCSVLERRTNVRGGDYLSLFWKGEWRNPPLLYGGVLGGEATQAPTKDGKVLLRTEKYVY